MIATLNHSSIKNKKITKNIACSSIQSNIFLFHHIQATLISHIKLKHVQDQHIIRFTMQFWPYMASGGSDFFHNGPRPSILLSLTCKYIKLSVHSSWQKNKLFNKEAGNKQRWERKWKTLWERTSSEWHLFQCTRSILTVTETERYEVIHTVLESNSWCGCAKTLSTLETSANVMKPNPLWNKNTKHSEGQEITPQKRQKNCDSIQSALVYLLINSVKAGVLQSLWHF